MRHLLKNGFKLSARLNMPSSRKRQAFIDANPLRAGQGLHAGGVATSGLEMTQDECACRDTRRVDARLARS